MRILIVEDDKATRDALKEHLTANDYEVVAARVLNCRVKRRESLHENFALNIAAPGATGDLREELKRALASAEVRQVKADIRVYDAHQRDIGEIKPLGNHLRAEQDVDFAVTKRIKDAGMTARLAHRV